MTQLANLTKCNTGVTGLIHALNLDISDYEVVKIEISHGLLVYVFFLNV